MKLLFTFTYNISLERWYNTGLIDREILIYRELAKKDVAISFLTYGNKTDFKYSHFLGSIRLFPISKYIESKSFFLKFLKSLFLPFKLKNFFTNFDLIKTGQIYGSWVAIIAKMLYGKKIIIRSGFEWLNATKNVIERRSLKKFIRYMLRYTFIFLNELFAYRLADGIILTSDYDIPFIIKYYKVKKKFKKNKIRLIYNFIDTELFRPISMPKKDKHILYIGSLHRGKNVVNLVKAFKNLNDFHLDIIGKGPDENKLRKIIEENNINVNFLGLFPNKKIPEIINQYHIFLLPSISEGNPKVLLEAMSCEIACIGTNIEGINNIITHKKNGYLCETDSESIGNAVISLYNDSALRKEIRKNGREFVLENCSLQSITKKEYEFYQEILRN